MSRENILKEWRKVGHSEKRRKRKMLLKRKENSWEVIKTLETSRMKRYEKINSCKKKIPSLVKKISMKPTCTSENCTLNKTGSQRTHQSTPYKNWEIQAGWTNKNCISTISMQTEESIRAHVMQRRKTPTDKKPPISTTTKQKYPLQCFTIPWLLLPRPCMKPTQ